MEKSEQGLYRTLLHGLATLRPESMCRLLAIYLQKSSGRAKFDWKTPDLKSMFYTELKFLPNNLEIFIDALDECSSDEVQEVVDGFERLLSGSTVLKVCWSSRFYPHIDLKTPQGVELELNEMNRDDIHRYIEDNIPTWLKQTWVQAVPEIVSKADGIFLWAILVAKRIEKAFSEGMELGDLKGVLSKTPKGLDQLFSKIFNNPEYTNEQKNDLQTIIDIVLGARRPLLIEELYTALKLDSSTSPNRGRIGSRIFSIPSIPENIGFRSPRIRSIPEDIGSRVPSITYIPERSGSQVPSISYIPERIGSEVSSITSNPENPSDAETMAVKQFEKYIIHASGGLIEVITLPWRRPESDNDRVYSTINPTRVQVIHESVREFFQTSDGLNFLGMKSRFEFERRSQATLTRICFNSLAEAMRPVPNKTFRSWDEFPDLRTDLLIDCAQSYTSDDVYHSFLLYTRNHIFDHFDQFYRLSRYTDVQWATISGNHSRREIVYSYLVLCCFTVLKERPTDWRLPEPCAKQLEIMSRYGTVLGRGIENFQTIVDYPLSLRLRDESFRRRYKD